MGCVGLSFSIKIFASNNNNNNNNNALIFIVYLDDHSNSVTWAYPS